MNHHWSVMLGIGRLSPKIAILGYARGIQSLGNQYATIRFVLSGSAAKTKQGGFSSVSCLPARTARAIQGKYLSGTLTHRFIHVENRLSRVSPYFAVSPFPAKQPTVERRKVRRRDLHTWSRLHQGIGRPACAFKDDRGKSRSWQTSTLTTCADSRHARGIIRA